MSKVNFFVAGSSKSGTTWLYKCLQAHPNVFVPEKDALHFFNLNYHKGTNWYHQWFRGSEEFPIICDPTPSYIRDAAAAQRIHDYNPDAKLVFLLRNPYDRLFSHYWHQKRKARIHFEIKDILGYNEVGNYDLFEIWVRPSLYYEQLKHYVEHFDQEQLVFFKFEHLQNNPEDLLKQLFEFLNIKPKIDGLPVTQKFNTAQKRQTRISRLDKISMRATS